MNKDIQQLIKSLEHGDNTALNPLIDKLTELNLTHQLNKILDYASDQLTQAENNQIILTKKLTSHCKRVLFWLYYPQEQITIEPYESKDQNVQKIIEQLKRMKHCQHCNGTGTTNGAHISGLAKPFPCPHCDTKKPLK